jgi:hypothetical protein
MVIIGDQPAGSVCVTVHMAAFPYLMTRLKKCLIGPRLARQSSHTLKIKTELRRTEELR